MPSALSWLDASAEDQRRMREIVGIFSQSDSRDELGIGQIRDVLSDALFPGTSVLITRARYLLFVPWCFQRAAESDRSGADVRRDRYERDLIVTLRAGDATVGLLGAQAGRTLKTLPSATYWNPIRRWGILADPDLTWEDALRHRHGHDEDEEAPTPASPWSATMPTMPSQFPGAAPGGFDLTRDEAEWLIDRITTSCDGTLLAHLADHRPSPDSRAPWEDGASLSAPPDVRVALEHARVFSQLVHGAALLYNLLLAEACVDAGFDRLTDRTERYRTAIDAWVAEREASAQALARWDLAEFQALIQSRNASISPRTWAFLRQWAAIATPDGPNLADSAEARDLVRDRERAHKGSQSRLRNRGLLAGWSGAAGSGALAFRWGAVRGILTDIHDGLERDRA